MGEIRWKDKSAIGVLTGAEKMPITDVGGTDYHVTPNQIKALGPFAHAADHIAGGSDAIAGNDLGVAFIPANYVPAAATLSGHLQGIDGTFARVADGVDGVASPLVWCKYANGPDTGIDVHPTDDGTPAGLAFFNQIIGVSVTCLGAPAAVSVDSIAGDFKTVTVRHDDAGGPRSLWVTIIGIINPAAAGAITTETGAPLETEGGEPIEF